MQAFSTEVMLRMGAEQVERYGSAICDRWVFYSAGKLQGWSLSCSLGERSDRAAAKNSYDLLCWTLADTVLGLAVRPLMKGRKERLQGPSR